MIDQDPDFSRKVTKSIRYCHFLFRKDLIDIDSLSRNFNYATYVLDSLMVIWEGEGSFEEADRSYYASPERKKVQPDPARHLEKADHFFIDPVVEEGKWTRMNRSGQRSGPKVSPPVADPHPTAD